MVFVLSCNAHCVSLMPRPLNVPDDEDDGGQDSMMETADQEDCKVASSAVTPEGSELMANTGPLLPWMPTGLFWNNVVNKGDDERLVTCTFVPSAEANSGDSFAAVSENGGKVLPKLAHPNI